MLCGELMPECVLAKPCNPLCDRESVRFEGNDVDWIIPKGLTALAKRKASPIVSLCMCLNNDVSSAHRSAEMMFYMKM